MENNFKPPSGHPEGQSTGLRKLSLSKGKCHSESLGSGSFSNFKDPKAQQPNPMALRIPPQLSSGAAHPQLSDRQGNSHQTSHGFSAHPGSQSPARSQFNNAGYDSGAQKLPDLLMKNVDPLESSAPRMFSGQHQGLSQYNLNTLN